MRSERGVAIPVLVSGIRGSCTVSVTQWFAFMRGVAGLDDGYQAAANNEQRPGDVAAGGCWLRRCQPHPSAFPALLGTTKAVMRCNEGRGVEGVLRVKTAAPGNRPRLLRQAATLSVVSHAAILAFLVFGRPVPPLEQVEQAAYSVVIETAPPAPPLEVSTPVEQTSQPASPTENEPPQLPPPQDTVTSPEATPEPSSVPPPAADVREPVSPAQPAPVPEQDVKPPPTPTNPRPPRSKVARTHGPAEPPVSGGREARPMTNSTPPVAREASGQAARPSPAWLASVNDWLMAHRFYPEIARRRGRQGTVVVRFEVNRLGQVLNVNMLQGSGSDVLDQAAITLVRTASLPPFPPGMPAAQETVTVPVHYRLD
jgi:periplasmic protein TonB